MVHVLVEIVALPLGVQGVYDKIWHYLNGTWLGKTPPVPGRYWHGIATDPKNKNRWLIWGSKDSGSFGYATIDGRLIAKGDTLDAFWITTNAGDSWAPYVVNTGIESRFNHPTSWITVEQPPIACFTRTNSHIAIGLNVRGIHKTLANVPLNELGLWREGYHIWGSEPRQTTLDIASVVAGMDDDIILSGTMTAGSSTRNTYAGYAPYNPLQPLSNQPGWIQVGGIYNAVGQYLPVITVEPGTLRAVAHSYFTTQPDTGLRTTTNYRTTMFGSVPPPYTGNHVNYTKPQSAAWGANGIYTTPTQIVTGHEGLIAINPNAPASDTRLFIPDRPNRVVVSQQDTQVAALVRLGASTELSTRYGVHDGVTWAELAGPAGVAYSQMSMAHAVLQGIIIDIPMAEMLYVIC